MRIKELTNMFDNLYPKNLMLDFDNSGMNVMTSDSNIKNILLCLDVTDEAIDIAINNDVNLIISHHPVIFNSIKNISESVISNKIKKLISYNICAYSIHTNFDASKDLGMGKIVLEQFDFFGNVKEKYPLEKIGEDGDGLGLVVSFNDSISLNSIREKLEDNFHIKKYFIKYYSKHSFDDVFIKKIAIMPGSGKSNVNDAIKNNVDVYISGDLGHHDILDLYENEITYVDATHYGLEKLFVYYMHDRILDLIGKEKINIIKYENKDF